MDVPVFKLEQIKVSDIFRAFADKLDNPEFMEELKKYEKENNGRFVQTINYMREMSILCGYDPNTTDELVSPKGH